MSAINSNTCPCCGGSLLRHIRQGQLYWFCKSCWQEVPLLTTTQMPPQEARSKVSLSQSEVKS